MAASIALQDALASLKDVEGVIGSFVVMDDGRLLCRDMGAFFSDELLIEVGPRLARLANAFSSANEQVTSCSLHYGGHLLHVRFMGQQEGQQQGQQQGAGPKRGRLCVLTDREVNRPAIRMVMNMVVRSLDDILVKETWPS